MRRATAIAAAVGLLAAAAGLRAQMANPVYPDDSPSARDTLSRAGEFVRSGNEAEAVRELQRLLDEQPDRVVQSGADADLFVSVRAMVHRTLLESPALLERYRAAEGPAAQRELEAGRHAAVEAARLLTSAGLEAALRVAQEHLEAGRFEASRLTLEQLEEHPDRRGPRGQDAARMIELLARYLPRPEVADRARRWAAEAGGAAPGLEPAERPAALSVRMAGLATPGARMETTDLPGEPLWTSPLLIDENAGQEPGRDRRGLAGEVGAAWILPSVVGDTVYVNDGTWISARDRFTLRPRWAVRPGADGTAEEPWGARGRALSGALERQVEDTSTVSVAAAGSVLVATTGIAFNESRDGDARTHAVGAADGSVLWSVDVGALDPQLEGGSVRGPALIDPLEGSTVVLAVRKSSQARRVVGAALVGLDLRTGALRWVRPIASAGAMPQRSEVRVANAGLLHRGVVYVTDQIGAMAAVEAETGRPVWVRRRSVSAQLSPPMELGSAWQWNAPVADGEAIVTLSPDRLDVLRLDARTGAITARRAAGLLGDPAYLLRVGDRIAAVGLSRIAFVPASDLGSGAVRLSPTFETPGIRGRVVVAGKQVLAPVGGGVAIIDPERPGEVAGRIELDRTGNVLPLRDQLVVASGGDLHSFLSWEVAQRLLEERMAADPADPSPAVIYAELAYRSGHPELIASAADRALAAIDRAPAAPASQAERQRLFGSLLEMVEAAQHERPGAPAGPALPAEVLGEVVRRLGLAADGHDQQVSHLMVLGRLHEMQGEAALAAESYQRVLAAPELAGASWRGPGASVRAELEAARRIRQLVVAHGPEVYAAFDAEAERRAARLEAGAAAEAVEAVARTYPGAGVTPGLWMRAAELHERAGRMHAAGGALREGLIAAEAAFAAGRDPAASGPALGEIAGRLVRLLESQDQLFAATQLLRRMAEDHPAVALTDRGQPLDSASLSEELVRRLAALERFPRIGPAVRPEAQVLQGWALMAPLGREGAARAGEHAMMISAQASEVALFGAAGAGAQGSMGSMEKLWSRPYEGRPPVLVRLDPEAVYLYWPSVRGGSIERIDAVGGVTRWRTEPFTDLFRDDAERQERINVALARGERIETPLDGPVRPTDLLVAIDEQAVALVERSGRAAVFDPATGELLWTVTGPVTQVHDIDAGAGVVAIGGKAEPVRPRGLADSPPMVVVYDARTGEAKHRMEELSGDVRWLRLGQAPGRALLIAGLESEALALDLASGNAAWTLTGGPAFGSLDAWAIGERLYLLDTSRTIWAVPLATGRAGDAPLETYEHLDAPGMIEAMELGSGHVAFATSSGVVVFDGGGTLVGMDGLGAMGGLLPPAAAESMFVVLEATPEDEDASRPTYALHMLESPGGLLIGTHRVVLWEAPRRVAVLDGRILITAGEVTLVLSAPETDRRINR